MVNRSGCMWPILLAASAGLLWSCGAEPEEDPAKRKGAASGGVDSGTMGKDWKDPNPVQVTTDSFPTPESVLHDPVADVYLVSCIDGAPLDADGKGAIARMNVDGTDIVLDWIAGGKAGVELNAPKGMAIVGDELWVTDIDHVRVFRRQDGGAVRSVPFPGAEFLNDIVAAPQGGAYVSDMGASSDSPAQAIYHLPVSGGPNKLLDGDLGQPNGLGVSPKGSLFFASWATGKVSLMEGEEVMALYTLPKQRLDGLVRLDDGQWLVSSWDGECVYLLSQTGEAMKLMADVKSPADIGFDRKRQRLLVPLFEQNKVTMVSLQWIKDRGK